MKRLLSVILCLLLIIAALPTAVFTVSADQGKQAEECMWELNGTVLTIRGNGAMENYEASTCGPWGKSVTEVIIEDGVTSIGDNAFYECFRITNITIPNSIKSIGNGAFRFCTNLTSVTIPNGVTSIGNNAFYQCSGLKSITIPDGVTNIGDYAFCNCFELAHIIIPDSVVDIGYNAFAATDYYDNEDNWEDEVLYIGSRLITAKESISGEYRIKSNTKAIESNAFYNCDSLTSVVIPDSVIGIGDEAFYDCDSLTSVTIGNGVTSIGNSAFYNCYSLTDVYYNGFKADKEKIIIASNNLWLTEATWRYYTSPGDVNGDEEVNGTDLALLKIYLAGASKFVESGADVNDDSAVNGTDLALLKLRLSGA